MAAAGAGAGRAAVDHRRYPRTLLAAHRHLQLRPSAAAGAAVGPGGQQITVPTSRRSLHKFPPRPCRGPRHRRLCIAGVITDQGQLGGRRCSWNDSALLSTPLAGWLEKHRPHSWPTGFRSRLKAVPGGSNTAEIFQIYFWGIYPVSLHSGSVA